MDLEMINNIYNINFCFFIHLARLFSFFVLDFAVLLDMEIHNLQDISNQLKIKVRKY